jgi:Uma2 family endonuclease
MSRPAIDPAAPRAPSEEEWDRLTDAERRAVVEALPALVPTELHPPEGDRHSRAKDRAVSALDEFFKRVGQKVYVSKELATYYPDEPIFCPDVLAVRDVETHPREKWVVSDEGKGLDFVLEVHVSGSRTKDFETNVRRYARLGIPEYFVFDRKHLRLAGWRLREPSAGRVYEPIVPQGGKFASRVLSLDLCVEDDRVRFYFGTAPLAEAEELVVRLARVVNDVTERAQREAERANELDARLAEALAEIERLRAR